MMSGHFASYCVSVIIACINIPGRSHVLCDLTIVSVDLTPPGEGLIV